MGAALLRVVLGVMVLGAAAAPVALAQGVEGDPNTPVGDVVENLFDQVVWASLAIGGLVEGLLIYALIRFRRRNGETREGPQAHGNTRLEIAWTTGPALVMAWLLVISYNGLREIDERPEPDFTVEVIGQQWFWTFIYPDGTQVTNGTLRVEEDQVVELRVVSRDVIHAFRVPALDVMVDANPGIDNYAWFEARGPGTYDAQCFQFCGLAHGTMRATVEVFPAGTQSVPYGYPAIEPNETAPPPPTNQSGNQTSGNGTGNATNVSADQTLDVIIENFAFSDAPYEFEPGTAVEFRLTNNDATTHNFFIGTYAQDEAERETLWNSSTMAGGESTTLVVDFPDEDIAYDLWCNIPGHADGGGMLTTVVIGSAEPGGGPAGAEPILPGLGAWTILIVLALVASVRVRAGSKR